VRIAQITHSYQPITGGADVWVHLLRGVCESAGHEVTVYQRPAEGFEDPSVRLVHSPLRPLLGARGEFWTVPFGLPRLKAELSRQDVLVVHYPNHHRMVEWHPRTVLISHGVFWDDFPGSLRSRIKRGLARRAYQKARLVVANDTFFLREVGEDVQPGAQPFSEVAPGRFFFPNCVDTTQFAPGPAHPELASRGAILVPRNLYRNRGIHLAIEAFARARDAVGDASLVVVGSEGRPGYLEQCRRLAVELRVSDRVCFFGAIPWAQMNAAYNAAEMTLIPTLCGEGTSLSALESMSCETATISTNVAGLADLPTVHCDPTAEALAESIAATWPQRSQIARQQRHVVATAYELSNWKRAWLDLIQRLAAD